ncbi:CC0125/CC1285 family lipoprotein [Pseudocolwellia agarivorans]|uniref:CC0125/CC1285 family lipoprotein n=1 Tax=Pseudocolwellia agarivorans TaxID=1911682 RepID=UPI0009869617|nr:hypothetical protein [Pseudocolwellia agarivorans]
MKKIIMLVSMVGLLAACASSPEYRAAKNNGVGYQESILNQDKIRVHFKTRTDNKLKAIDYTFLRAAELTVQQGYDWFVVTNRDVIIDGQNQPRSSIHTGIGTRRDCGIYGCSNQPSTHLGIGFNLGEQGQEIESIVDIKLGKGVRPEQQESYEAREIITNMRAKYELKGEYK